MNVGKADYGTIIKFGTMRDFNMKMQMEVFLIVRWFWTWIYLY